MSALRPFAGTWSIVPRATLIVLFLCVAACAPGREGPDDGAPDAGDTDAGTPPGASSLAADLIGAAVLVVCLGPGTGLVAVVLLLGACAFLGWLSLRQIEGQTGDVLGALEQAGEVIVLLVASAAMQNLR